MDPKKKTDHAVAIFPSRWSKLDWPC